MRQVGRKSASSQIAHIPGKRPPPPADLTPTQQQLWHEVTTTKPFDWFTADSWPLLRQYVSHVEAAQKLNAMINAADDIGRLDKLLAQRERESKILIRLATAMRLTQHSRLKSDTAASAANNSGDPDRPWEPA